MINSGPSGDQHGLKLPEAVTLPGDSLGQFEPTSTLLPVSGSNRPTAWGSIFHQSNFMGLSMILTNDIIV